MHTPGLIKAPALAPGDTIGIVSPSWFGGDTFVPRAKRGIAMLEALGFRTRVAPHAFNNRGHVSDIARNRVDDLHAMFEDPDVQAILCTIGGNHSNQLLSLIDWELIRANPKVFMGFSDITVLNIAIHVATGLVTFNGPSLLTDWAEYPQMPEISRESALRTIGNAAPAGPLPAAQGWTDEFLDWESAEDTTRRREYVPSEGWTRLRAGTAAGPLIGGCLESLQHLRGTPWWPRLDGAILFIETSEDCRGPADADALLMDFENMGVFEEISGMLVGRPYGMDAAQREQFLEIVAERTAGYSFPVVADLDIGHTSPLLTLPIGVQARIDGDRHTVVVTEAAVEERRTLQKSM